MTSEPRRLVDERLADWADGRMSERDRERFAAELRVNPQLRQDLADYERTVGVLRAALRAPTTPVPIADRVMAAIEVGAAAGPRRIGAIRLGSRFGRHAWWSLATAAALLAGALWLDGWAPRGPQTTSSAHQDPAAPAGGGQDRGDAAPVGEPTPPAPEAAPLDKNAPFPQLDASGERRLDEVERERRRATAADEAPVAKAAIPTEEVAAPVAPPPPSVGAPAPGAPAGPGRRGAGGGEAAGAARPTGVETYGADRREQVATGATGGERIALLRVDGPVPPPPKDAGAKASQSTLRDDAARQGESKGSEARLSLAALQTAIDAFLTAATTGEVAAGVIEWRTERGRLRLSPVDDPAALDGQPPAPRTSGSAAAPLAVDRTWLVEGDRSDLQVLLGRLGRFTRDHGLRLHSGEVVAPPAAAAEPGAGPAAGAVAPAPPSPATDREVRLVLRLQLRPRR